MKKVKKKVKRKVKRVTKQPTIAEIAEAELRDGGTLDSTAGTVKDGPREESATPKPKRKAKSGQAIIIGSSKKDSAAVKPTSEPTDDSPRQQLKKWEGVPDAKLFEKGKVMEFIFKMPKSTHPCPPPLHRHQRHQHLD